VLLETARLLLRPFGPEDLDDLVALHEDPEVTRYITTLDRAAAEERLRQDADEWRRRGHGMLAILGRPGSAQAGTGRFLGRATVKHWPQFDETEVGWTLRRDAWGRGYATEAGRACVDWAFAELDVPYLTAMIAPGNHRSVRVAQRLGFKPMREDVLLGEPVIVHSRARPPG
jgi:RimJ/RimL family protein N-acetyltransferase